MSRQPRSVLVVGATGRLGVAIAHALVARGDRVLVTGRDPTKLESLADDLERADGARAAAEGTTPRRPVVIPKNLLLDDAPHEIAERARAAGDVTDVVLACGPFPRTPIEQLSRADLDLTLRVHAIAPLLLVNELSAELARHEGAVVALTDGGVTRPYPNHVAYLTAKGALQAGLRALAVELGPHVRANVVALGIVADPEADADPLRTHRMASRSPLGRMGTPAEVVHAVLSLLDATWATGEIWGIGR
ncbi:MAG: SDR family oxidoreductase [Myxococcales bacterium]|nr:SDR family oxidoreductase [Myxococcales bacterium]